MKRRNFLGLIGGTIASMPLWEWGKKNSRYTLTVGKEVITSTPFVLRNNNQNRKPGEIIVSAESVHIHSSHARQELEEHFWSNSETLCAKMTLSGGREITGPCRIISWEWVDRPLEGIYKHSMVLAVKVI